MKSGLSIKIEKLGLPAKLKLCLGVSVIGASILTAAIAMAGLTSLQLRIFGFAVGLFFFLGGMFGQAILIRRANVRVEKEGNISGIGSLLFIVGVLLIFTNVPLITAIGIWLLATGFRLSYYYKVSKEGTIND